jgi:hypothetical protein
MAHGMSIGALFARFSCFRAAKNWNSAAGRSSSLNNTPRYAGCQNVFGGGSMLNVGWAILPGVCSISDDARTIAVSPLKGDRMKKLFTFVCALLLGASLSFAQATGGSTDKAPKTTTTPKTASGKKATKTKKGHKGGKKASADTNSGGEGAGKSDSLKSSKSSTKPPSPPKSGTNPPPPPPPK